MLNWIFSLKCKGKTVFDELTNAGEIEDMELLSNVMSRNLDTAARKSKSKPIVDGKIKGSW